MIVSTPGLPRVAGVIQLLVLGLAGLLGGAALGAVRAQAPRPLVVTLLVMMGLALVLAGALLVADPPS